MRGGSFHSTILIPLIFFICFSSPASTCPGDPCICEQDEVQCVCNQNGVRENVTLDDMVKMGGWHSIKVEHCDVVRVKFGAFRFVARLDSVTFHDIKTLIIEGDAFNAITELHTVTISQIASFHPSSHVFYKIGNISNFFLTDVKVNVLPTGFIGASHCNMLVLSDLDVRSIDQFAFFFERAGHVAIDASSIGTIHTEAISISKSAAGVFLKNIKVGTMEFEAMNFSEISSHLIVQDSTFETFQQSFLKVQSAKYFAFQRNIVDYCETKSFDSVVVEGELFFANNSFERALDECFPRVFSRPKQSTLTGNHFNCDCQLEWFYEKKYGEVYYGSTCTLEGKDTMFTNLSETEIILGPDGQCRQVAHESDEISVPSKAPPQVPQKPQSKVQTSSSSVCAIETFYLSLSLLYFYFIKDD